MTIFKLVTTNQKRARAEMELWARNGAGSSYPLVNMTPERSREVSREMANAMLTIEGDFVLTDD